jgi:hypothetical protein
MKLEPGFYVATSEGKHIALVLATNKSMIWQLVKPVYSGPFGYNGTNKNWLDAWQFERIDKL